MDKITTFIIPSLHRPTLSRTIKSVGEEPYLVRFDDLKEGAGITRNKLIQQAKTEWVSMLDDDDTIVPQYVACLEKEIAEHPDADVIMFKAYFQHGVIIPAWPEVAFSNIPISFSVRREVALEHPFENVPFEDYEFIKKLNDLGKKIIFSKYLTYLVRY